MIKYGARKLKRSGANLLGGRALRYELFPLVYKEIPDFDLNPALEGFPRKTMEWRNNIIKI